MGSFFTGYLLALAMDADSQIMTAVDVLAANGDEAAAATAVMTHGERVQGNDLVNGQSGFSRQLAANVAKPQGLGPQRRGAAYPARAIFLFDGSGLSP
jgi:hypothetical protein